MKPCADSLALPRGPMSLQSPVSQVLVGLDEEYNPIVVVIQRNIAITWSKLQIGLLTFEECLEHQFSHKKKKTCEPSLHQYGW